MQIPLDMKKIKADIDSYPNNDGTFAHIFPMTSDADGSSRLAETEGELESYSYMLLLVTEDNGSHVGIVEFDDLELHTARAIAWQCHRDLGTECEEILI